MGRGIEIMFSLTLCSFLLLTSLSSGFSFFSPWYLDMMELSEPSQTKVLMKRSASATPEEGVRQGIQVSITANFQALQQKLRRELLLRGVREGDNFSSRILRSQG